MQRPHVWGVLVILACSVVLGDPMTDLCHAALNSSPGPWVMPSTGPVPPRISTLVKPELWKKMIEDRDVLVHASLRDVADSKIKKYSFYAAMLVKTSVAQAKSILMNYKLYSEMIPYVDRAEYSAKTQILDLEGGIWNYRVQSQVLFEKTAEQWIHYRIVGGSFSGLAGDIYFESLGEKGTTVYLKGEQLGKKWPPQFVIEKGAEIVFGYTAKRMRSYIESQKKKGATGIDGEQQGRQSAEEIPQPRSHL